MISNIYTDLCVCVWAISTGRCVYDTGCHTKLTCITLASASLYTQIYLVTWTAYYMYTLQNKLYMLHKKKNVVHVTSTSQYPCQNSKIQKSLFLASRLLVSRSWYDINHTCILHNTCIVSYQWLRTQLASLCCSLTLFCRDQARLNHEQKDIMSDSHSDGEILIEKGPEAKINKTTELSF